jgi:hypothetical protein
MVFLSRAFFAFDCAVKRWYVPTSLRGVTTQRTGIDVVALF